MALTQIAYDDLQRLVDGSGVNLVNFDIGTYHGGRRLGAAKIDVERLHFFIDKLNQNLRPVCFLMHGGSSVAMPWEEGHDPKLLDKIRGYVTVWDIATNTKKRQHMPPNLTF